MLSISTGIGISARFSILADFGISTFWQFWHYVNSFYFQHWAK
jgi:hypothetical protein